MAARRIATTTLFAGSDHLAHTPALRTSRVRQIVEHNLQLALVEQQAELASISEQAIPVSASQTDSPIVHEKRGEDAVTIVQAPIAHPDVRGGLPQGLRLWRR